MKNKRFRFIALVVLVVVAGALCGFRLIEFQIVNGEEYLEQTLSLIHICLQSLAERRIF